MALDSRALSLSRDSFVIAIVRVYLKAVFALAMRVLHLAKIKTLSESLTQCRLSMSFAVGAGMDYGVFG